MSEARASLVLSIMAVVVSSYTTDVPFSALNRLMLMGSARRWKNLKFRACCQSYGWNLLTFDGVGVTKKQEIIHVINTGSNAPLMEDPLEGRGIDAEDGEC